MKNILFLYILILLLSIKIAFGQQVYKLSIIQPPSLSYTILEELFLSQGESVYLDTLYRVNNNIFYNIQAYENNLDTNSGLVFF